MSNENNELYPDYYKEWDDALNKGLNPNYYDADELCEIIDIYLSEDEIRKGKITIDYTLKLYPDNEEVIYEILLLLNDYELWNDLLVLAEKYKDLSLVWADGHKLTALLHLGMEEDAFHFFRKLKSKYAENNEDLSIIYQAMAEALYDVDLFEASIDVISEAISLVGEEVDLLWLILQNYQAINDKEGVLTIAEKIQKKNPLNAETWSRLGNAYKEIDETEKSIEAFEFAQSLGNNDSNDLMSLIYAYEKNDNYNKALEKIEEYLVMHPESYVVNLMGANDCAQIQNWERALTYINRAIFLIPEMENLYMYQSDFLLKLGEYKKAIAALEEGIKRTKDSLGLLSKQIELIRKQYPD